MLNVPFYVVFITLIILTSILSKLTYADINKPLPISAYGNLPDVSNLQLSPNGESLAMLKNVQGTLVLMTFNLKTGEKRHVLKADNTTVLLNWYRWANDDILLVSVGQTERQGRTIKYTTTTLRKFDLSKKAKLTQLVKPSLRKGDRDIYAQFQDNVISFLPEQPDKILMAISYERANRPSLYEVNVRTSKRKRVKKPKDTITAWTADQQGNPRISHNLDETTVSYTLHNQAGKKIKTLWSYQVFEKGVVNILGFDKEPNSLYIRALYQGKYAIFKVDLHDESLTKKLVLADDKYDVDGSLIYSPKTGAVVGLNHEGNHDNKTYWDEEYVALKKGLNKAIPNANNTIISMSHDLTRYILYSSSNYTAGDYYIGDRKEKAIDYLASRYPEINETNYATKKLITYKARDGLAIEGYLTQPINSKENNRLPAIILPHGGPMARDYSGFDYWAELFANQGYVVFQPNFRGSSGYGYDFEMAAIEGWGKAMQDDLQDAAHWLNEQHIIDEKRVCIAGASYGGYAALMAAVKHGNTFQCAASFAGVSDIELIVSKARYFTNKEVVRKQFGTDNDKLAAASPVNFAKDINIPILLIHGSDDKIVPIAHSREMADELKDANKDVRYVEIDGANHHLSVQKHRIQTLEEMLAFFDKHLK